MVNSIGYNFLIPTFTDVGAKEATYDLQNIKIVDGYGDGYTESIEVWDETGSMTDDSYWWCTMSDCGVEDGWYTMGGEEKIEGVDLNPGEGIFINLQTGDAVQFTLPNPLTYVYPTK